MHKKVVNGDNRTVLLPLHGNWLHLEDGFHILKDLELIPKLE